MDKETMELLQSVPKEVWLQLYNDAPRPMLKQFGRLGEDLIKTIRFVTFPLQYAAYAQDRIERGFAQALEKVDKEQRVLPPEGLALDIADKLKHHDTETLVGKLYVELLSASMNESRAHQAHPAFLPIISQLSADEAYFLLRLSENIPSLYVRERTNWLQVSPEQRESYLGNKSFPIEGTEVMLRDITLKPEELYYPENFYIYIEHLNELGLLEYSNEYSNKHHDQWRANTAGLYDMWFIQLTKFGRLFFQCCCAALENTKR
ncbi:Abi-alpha family protein [Citrobacter portucalensis]|uniref:Abi-alpha family protein n=1 Tax=Citrobacter portucalensis TaxID=1639133 RepID=UPI003CF4D742